MNLAITSELEAALQASAQRAGVSPEQLALDALRQRFLNGSCTSAPTPADEWERKLRNLATDCGVSLSHEALSSEGLYD